MSEIRRRLRHQGWSVRAHLAAIFLAVLLVLVVVGAFLARETLQRTRVDARDDSKALAERAAEVLGDQLGGARATVVELAASPALAEVLAEPTPCQLNFGLFPDSRLDVVRSDGQVMCSSAPEGAPRASHAGAAWLAALAPDDAAFLSEPFDDPSSGKTAVAIGMPIVDATPTVIGVVAAIVPTEAIAGQLADTVGGGTRPFRFTIVDERTGTLLSASPELPPASDGTDPLRSGSFLAGSDEVPDAGWRVSAGLSESTAMAPARSWILRGIVAGGAAMIALLASLAVVSRRIARPLRRLTIAVSDSGPVADELLRSVRGPREIVRLADRFRAALAAHEDYENRLAHEALHDPMTGLPNRVLLDERLVHSLQHAARTGKQVGVLLLDLDRFKLVNDSLGHIMGDEVLANLAIRLAEVLPPGDTLARFGGDEFVVASEGLGGIEEAELLADRLLAVTSAPIQAGDTVVRLTASIGIALSAPDSTATDLVREADTARYVAKERGGARFEVFDRQHRIQASRRLSMENEFRVALERGELHLVYQPKVDLVTRGMVGAEALLRWEHPAFGSVSPATFIPIAEETGLIVPVGRFVLEEACRQVARWARDGLVVPVAVNVSGRQLVDPSLVGDVSRALTTSGTAPSLLCLELTESMLMLDTAHTASTLGELHGLGVRLSIDDFGTGYSSLGYLHRFPVDELKIDRSFVVGMTEHAGQGTLVAAMVAMARALGLDVVAEGVETEEQAAQLRRLECWTAQGYLFARPEHPDKLGPMLQTMPPASRVP